MRPRWGVPAERTPAWLLGTALAVPLLGLVLVLGIPEFDVHWEHHPSHFWLVLGVAAIDVALGLVVSEAARQRRDVRLFLVSMVLLAAAGFLALHALATPGVVLNGPNGGFVLATPVGLLIASGFAAWSATDLEPHEEAILRWEPWIRLGLLLVIVAWAVLSLLEVPPMDQVFDTERTPVLRALTPIGIVAYGFAAWRYVGIYRARRRPLPLAVAASFVLLAEALVAVALSRAWRVSWWEWHLLMAVAFATILLAARREYREERSFVQAFGGLYLERTLERVDRRGSQALTTLATADAEGRLDDATHELRHEGFTADEIAVLADSARELARLDELLRRYVGPQLAERLGEDPAFADLGGREREVSILFADLAGFTSFAEGRGAPQVIDMLNAYWSEVVPAVVDREGGLIERFAGDAVLVVFNALGDHADHALRAARAALAIRDGSERIRAAHPDWPRFRVGVNTGPVVIGNVGAGDQRSFSAIGDATNVAARLQSRSAPGRVTIAERTVNEARGEGAVVHVRDLGPLDLKGKTEPVEAFELVDVG